MTTLRRPSRRPPTTLRGLDRPLVRLGVLVALGVVAGLLSLAAAVVADVLLRPAGTGTTVGVLAALVGFAALGLWGTWATERARRARTGRCVARRATKRASGGT